MNTAEAANTPVIDEDAASMLPPPSQAPDGEGCNRSEGEIKSKAVVVEDEEHENKNSGKKGLASTTTATTTYKYRDFGSLSEQEIEAATASSSPNGDCDDWRSSSPIAALAAVSVPPSNASTKTPSSIRAQKFPVKLYAILSREEFQDIIAWLPHGRSWKVLKPNLFESMIMPLFFEYRNYHSFNRLINAWSFRRIQSNGPDRGSYYHELFLRGKPQLHKFMRRLPKTHKKLPMEKEDEPNFRKLSQASPLPQLGERQEQDYWNSMNRERQAMSADGFVAVTPPHGMVKDQQHSLMMKAASAVVENDDVVIVGRRATSIPTKLRSLGGGEFCNEQSQLSLPPEKQQQLADPIMRGGVVNDTSYDSLSYQQSLMTQSDGLSMNSQFYEPSLLMDHGRTMMLNNNMMDSTTLTTSMPSSSQFGMAHMYNTQQQMMQQPLPNNYAATKGYYDGSSMMMAPSSSMMTMGDPYQQRLQYSQPQGMRMMQPQHHLAAPVGMMNAANVSTYYEDPSSMRQLPQSRYAPILSNMGSFI